MIFIIEDDLMMAECLQMASVVRGQPLETQVFTDTIAAMEAIAGLAEPELPQAILLDVMVNGPNGFTFLHELASYPETAKIPVILISTLDLSQHQLKDYGVVRSFDKAKLTPQQLQACLEEYV